MIEREKNINLLEQLLTEFPVVALIGARQIGKTTLARQIMKRWHTECHYYDLESTIDLARLTDPMLSLMPLHGLIILDEIQQLPEIFKTIRVLADREPSQAQFLILGSAAPALLKQSCESLAGRIAYFELSGLSFTEVNIDHFQNLWLRGGFPRSYLAANNSASYRWRLNFARNFLERDIPQFGIGASSKLLERFWIMLSHYHAQVWNGAELGRSFGVSHTTVRRYLDIFDATFMVRCLTPWKANIYKRQVKSPKIYIRDSGLLHSMLGIKTFTDLDTHPKLGASWEGFIIENLIQMLGVENHQCHFWATHNGAEIDLVVDTGGRLRGFEVKRTSSPKITPSMRTALNDLELTQIDVIHAGEDNFRLSEEIRAVAAKNMLNEYSTSFD